MDEERDAGGETVVPVEIDGQKVLLSVGPGGRPAGPALGEEQEIGWGRPRLEPVLDGLTALARAMGTRLQQTGASRATVEFGCDISFDTGQFLAVVGKASTRSTWKVTLEWTAAEAPGA
ncbi:CU044_2847 family protein [Streptomyces sp. NPDC001093]|uniref:CU044_2847 family protein n=1 Tax=Streptomyces sp. NPDC001093 TaxID=3154376 RepID=UPI0033343214